MGLPEDVHQRGAERDDAGPASQPARDLHAQAPAARALVDRGGVAGPCRDTHREMIAQVLAHARQVLPDGDAVPGQQRRRADAGQLQQLGRVQRAAAQQHFPPGGDGARQSALAVAHACRAPSFEQDGIGLRADAQVDPAAPYGWVQEGVGGGNPAALLDDALEVPGALLRRAVVIGVARDAELGGAGDEGFAQGARPVGTADRQAASAAAIRIVAGSDASFGALEVRQHVGVGPAGIAAGRPVVEIRGLAAAVGQAVDGGGAADDPPLRQPDLATAQRRIRLGRERPGIGRVVERLDEADGHPDQRMTVGDPRLQHADRGARVGQPVGQHAAGRSGADHHIVEHGAQPNILPFSRDMGFGQSGQTSAGSADP